MQGMTEAVFGCLIEDSIHFWTQDVERPKRHTEECGSGQEKTGRGGVKYDLLIFEDEEPRSDQNRE
jgi:hypothetical protein